MDAFIVGWVHTKFGKLDALDLEALIKDATRQALANAGIEGQEVDGVWLGNFNSGLVPDGFCSSMILHADPGLRFKPAITCENACAPASAALYSSLDAVKRGRCRIALFVGATTNTGVDNAGWTKATGRARYNTDATRNDL